MKVDAACWERGCPCYDSKEGEGVEVIKKEWVGLTDHELQVLDFNDPDRGKLARAVEAKLKERNT